MGPGARNPIGTADRQAPVKCRVSKCVLTQMNKDQCMGIHDMSNHNMSTRCSTSHSNMDQHTGIHSMNTQNATA